MADVFVNICEDEGEHVKTMRACQDYALLGTVVESPHVPRRPRAPAGSGRSGDDGGGVAADGSQAVGAHDEGGGSAEEVEEARRRREAWKRWTEQLHEEMVANAGGKP